MQKSLQSKDNKARLYIQRRRGWLVANIIDSVDATIQELEGYSKKEQGKTYFSS